MTVDVESPDVSDVIVSVESESPAVSKSVWQWVVFPVCVPSESSKLPPDVSEFDVSRDVDEVVQSSSVS